jgi:hypothetical protein
MTDDACGIYLKHARCFGSIRRVGRFFPFLLARAQHMVGTAPFCAVVVRGDGMAVVVS